jgi:biotin-(acetyl-CoA carboxylase) ligase
VRDAHEPFGGHVDIKTGGAETRGIARAIDDEGRFVIELPDGSRKAFVAGDVELIRPVK